MSDAERSTMKSGICDLKESVLAATTTTLAPDASSSEMEVLDESEWLGMMEQFKRGGEQEMIIKRNYTRSDQQVP